MSSKLRGAFIATFAALLLPTLSAIAAPTTAPADPASDRLTFLMLRLGSTEASITAVNAAMKAAGYKANVAADKAETYQKGNELMDRKGGAPVPWDVFYGKSAKSFHTYWNDPVRRPKQFDYLYHANNEQATKAMKEVAAMEQKVDVLLARRRQLEAEQSAIWAIIALESIGSREIGFRPLYRFGLTTAGAKGAAAPAQTPRLDIVKAAVLFLNAADRYAATSAEDLETTQPQTIKELRETIENGEAALRESILRATASPDISPADEQKVKDLLTIAKQMQVECKNISEAYRLAADGDSAGDEPRKQTFRGQLQESLLGFADATGELDDAITQLAQAWSIHGDPAIPAPAASVQIERGALTVPSKQPTAATDRDSMATTISSGDMIAVGSLESKRAPVLAHKDGLITFRAPDRDQWWTGANGVLLRPDPTWEQKGTVWQCGKFQSRPSGLKFIHPFRGGHLLVEITEKGVRLRSGGKWSDNAEHLPISLAPAFEHAFPLDRNVPHVIQSALEATGDYKLFIDGKLAATARVEQAEPLSLSAGFVGDGLPKVLQKGQAGVIVDNSYGSDENAIAGDLTLSPGEETGSVLVSKPELFTDAPVASLNPINLLDLIDTSLDTVAGKWSLETSGGKTVLVNRQGEFCRIQFPYRPPEEYDFQATFTYTTNGGPIILMCPLSDGAIMWHTEFNKSALESRGKQIVQGTPPFVTRGQPQTSLVKVRKDKVQAYLNDRLVCEFDRRAQKPPALSPGWKLHDSKVLGVGVWGSDTTFSKIEVVEISGSGSRLRSVTQRPYPNGTPVEPTAPPATVPLNESSLARMLNDPNHWTIKNGTWDLSVGKLHGEGDSEIVFDTPLPSHITFSLRINVLKGMRPRIMLNGTGITFGNEAYTKNLFPHGPKDVTGAEFTYKNNESHLLTFKLAGDHFDISIDDKPAFSGTCKTAPSIHLSLQAGDWWSPGATDCSDFQVKELPR